MKRAPGILPSPKWLITNGYASLHGAMQRHPEAFAHIQQASRSPRGRTPEEWAAIAEELAAEHGGSLPSAYWLLRHGHQGLAAAIRRFPEHFTDLRQEKADPPKNWVSIAEQLASSHGGVLPNPKWLVQNRYGRLLHSIRENPHLFRHIQQARLRQPQQRYSLEGHITKAKELALKHGGTLPHCHWLYKNGYGGLYQAIKDHPEAFRHITQEKRSGQNADDGQILANWRVVAEKLAKEQGCLPGYQWLVNHGCRGLYLASREAPRTVQTTLSANERTCRSVDDWLRIAERLVAEHGRLPRYGWLIQNGYRGLCQALARQPNLFAHLMP